MLNKPLNERYWGLGSVDLDGLADLSLVGPCSKAVPAIANATSVTAMLVVTLVRLFPHRVVSERDKRGGAILTTEDRVARHRRHTRDHAHIGDDADHGQPVA
jgi:hypothetical protein